MCGFAHVNTLHCSAARAILAWEPVTPTGGDDGYMSSLHRLGAIFWLTGIEIYLRRTPAA